MFAYVTEKAGSSHRINVAERLNKKELLKTASELLGIDPDAIEHCDYKEPDELAVANLREHLRQAVQGKYLSAVEFALKAHEIGNMHSKSWALFREIAREAVSGNLNSSYIALLCALQPSEKADKALAKKVAEGILEQESKLLSMLAEIEAWRVTSTALAGEAKTEQVRADIDKLFDEKLAPKLK